MKRQFWLYIELVVVIIFSTGCYNYIDIDNVIFSTDTIIDISEDENVIVYVRAFKGVKSLEETEVSGEILTFKSEAKTLFQAIRNLTLQTSEKINFSQNKMVIFTEKAATQGVEKYMDMLVRGQEYNLRTMILIYSGEVEELLSVELKQEKNLGLYLWETQRNGEKQSGKIKISYINDFLNDVYEEPAINIVPEIAIEKNLDDTHVNFVDNRIFKEWIMVDSITNEEVVFYNFLIDNIHSTIITVEDEIVDDNYLSFEVLSNNTETKTKLEDEKFIVETLVKPIVTLGESQKSIELNDENLEKINKELNEQMQEKCMELVKKYQKKDLDILKVGTLYERNTGEKAFDGILNSTEFRIKIDATIEGTLEYKDFL